jgi:selenocysteine lyase/cysteine desulfurase
MAAKSALEDYFAAYRKNIIGLDAAFNSPFGKKRLIYADWTASGRAYRPIEEYLQNEILPFWANTHSGTTATSAMMSDAYEQARMIVKQHVHAGDDDSLLFCGSGMTSAVNKLQRLLGLRLPERLADYVPENHKIIIDEMLRPVVFVTDMEHHSNHISWLETIADVEIIPAGNDGHVDLAYFGVLLEKYRYRKNKIAAVTACSNVTGIETAYTKIAQLIHQYGGVCFVDFACSAPYVDINMHPEEKDAHLDAIYFSAHKFLGGPGTPGILVFNSKLYTNKVPDQPGGGTLSYTNPWKAHEYSSDIESREDGGTPPLLQGIKAAMCIRLKEEMGIENIRAREEELLQIIFNRFKKIKGVEVLEQQVRKRLAVVSFIVKGAHHNLFAKLLNDRFGVQARGGCSCAGTYGHRLLQVGRESSYKILESIRAGDLSAKPGWIRISIHPTMSNDEVEYMMYAIELTAVHLQEWSKDYCYNMVTNEYAYRPSVTKLQPASEKSFLHSFKQTHVEHIQK